MSKLLWLIGGTTLALAVFAILNNEDFAQATAGGAENAADKLSAWGAKQRATGTGGSLLGKVKQVAGDLAGSDKTSAAGTFDQAAGAVKNAAGQAAQALGSSVRDISSK